ncbi:hypothetical protein Syun_029832 [Stephania yunnanensis]|uniref:Uncharacterized protein n=1 Tax=Stephania yunnanensis TaxID=152371 RepID=A0AAP0E9C2_9MAGN
MGPHVGGVDFLPRTRVRCVKVVEEGTRGFLLGTHMAQSKTGVSKERVYGNSNIMEQAASISDTCGWRKPQTTLYRKEKQ